MNGYSVKLKIAIYGYFFPGGGRAMLDRMATVGRILQQVREAAGFSQAQLSERAGVSVHVIRKIEQGQVGEASWGNMVSLARALGVSLDVFAGAQPAAPPTAGGAAKRGPGRPRKRPAGD
jgi:transcriptional regulator with XRE-family HTH domain